MNRESETRRGDDDLADLIEHPTAYTLFAAIRVAQAARADTTPVGRSTRFYEDGVVLRQRPTTRFEPAEVVDIAIEETAGRPRIVIEQVAFGPYGATGALPPQIAVDAAREARGGRPWLKGFLDLFTHRMTAFLYRAFEAGDLAASREAGGLDPYAAWANSLFGAGPSAFRERDAIGDDVKRHLAGHLSAGRRSAAAIEGVLHVVVGQPVEVRQFVPEWLAMPEDAQARLGAGPATLDEHDIDAARLGRDTSAARLGRDTTLGPRFFSVSTRFRVTTRPLGYAGFAALLPDGARHAAMRDAVRALMGLHRLWELQPVLAGDAVPECRLDGRRRLGFDGWLGRRQADRDADDLVLTMRPPS